jgi:hypothetical protein
MDVYEKVEGVAKLIGVSPATVKKYCTLFEREGYTFKRNDEGHILFSNYEIRLLKELMTLKKQPGMTVLKAVKQIANKEATSVKGVTDIKPVSEETTGSNLTDMSPVSDEITGSNETDMSPVSDEITGSDETDMSRVSDEITGSDETDMSPVSEEITGSGETDMSPVSEEITESGETDMSIMSKQVAMVMNEITELKKLIKEQNELIKLQQAQLESLQQRDVLMVQSLKEAMVERKVLNEVAADIESGKKKGFFARLFNE